GSRGSFNEPRMFNGLLRTYLGAVEEDGESGGESGLAYLRPETAQGIFINFRNVLQTSRKKVPFGIGQIGKSFRNEITPGNFIFRTREFEQMEMEFFVKPGTDEEWHEYWIATRKAWYTGLGLREENLRLYEHPAEKRSHYSKRTVDIEYRYQFPGSEWGELEGIANRTDFDLSTHARASGQDMSYLDTETGERFIPYVIEPAGGGDRSMLVFLMDAYAEDEAPDASGKPEKRTVLRLDHRLAPARPAVLRLPRNADLPPKARDLAAALRDHWNIDFDDAGAIGRRYRRHDEIGTPYCVTVDFDSLNDQAVTVRERDSMRQDRVSIDALGNYLAERLSGGWGVRAGGWPGGRRVRAERAARSKRLPPVPASVPVSPLGRAGSGTNARCGCGRLSWCGGSGGRSRRRPGGSRRGGQRPTCSRRFPPSRRPSASPWPWQPGLSRGTAFRVGAGTAPIRLARSPRRPL